MIRTVSALLYRFNGREVEILLHKHKRLKDGGGALWLGVGGKVESDEHEIDALIREVWEESGISLMYNVFAGTKYDYQRYSFISPNYTTRIDLDNGDTMYDHVYVLEAPFSDAKLEPESEDVELGWYKADFALKHFNLYNDTRIQIENLRDQSHYILLGKLDDLELDSKFYERP